ncbi:DUF4998 domain-containing protein [Maribellus sp. YY47]|uniref:DUF4998 domain-containing protein n=1 Tax=Maribellus sp. YY47 TaxID=2929486 RepID=UPI002001282D|nr:DUF4998 domain-containing protein [Maribellus sp. YY47]MCK3684472.1 DUF4998 domain-containing protein [Maribellus sp. YY47]
MMKIFLNKQNTLVRLVGVFIGIFLISLIYSSCVNGIYDNIKEFSTEEIVYPAAFDTCFGTIGYERVEIDLRKDGRIPASKITMGKAKKTVVVYDENTPDPKVIEIDSVCSYVNITGLTEPRLYRFNIYTEDEYGDRSIPQEISLIPYTSYDRDVLKLGILDPTVSVAPNALIMEWPTGLNTIMMEYHGLQYQYEDQSGESQHGIRSKEPRIYCGNLPAGQEMTFNMKYKVLPILDGGSKLLDTLEIEKPYIVQMPTPEQQFIPQELKILLANGINTFTTEAVKDITELTYPMNMTTFADLFFFPGVSYLNLTGKGLPGTLESLTYARNNEYSIVGGGAWQEFMMPVDQPSKIKGPESLQTLKDMLDAGQITHIKYIPKSMGLDFDRFLEPYVQSGVVELLTNDNPFFPDHVFVDPQFFANGTVQDNNWKMKLAYSGDFLPRGGLADIGKFNPQSDIVNGQAVDLHLEQLIQSDGENIYRGIVENYRPSFFFALPRQWRFDNARYPYLKFKMFIGCDKSLVSNVGGNKRNVYRAPWIRPMNRLWSFSQNSDYGQENWDSGRNESMTDDEIQNSWHEYTINMSNNDGGDNSNRRNRVYVVNIGHEDGVTWTYDANNQVVIYIADVRLCKTPND